MQNKSYIHVDDVVRAVLHAETLSDLRFDVFNISTRDQVTVNRIAELTEIALGINPQNIEHFYTGGDRGWKADVPVVRLSAEKLEKFGWSPTYTSEEAIVASLKSMAESLNG